MKNTEEAIPPSANRDFPESALHLRMPSSRASQIAAILGVSILLVTITRLPLQPRYLYSFDSVNLALALEDFDPSRNQPQPPGYPLFVLEARLFYFLLGTPERTFAVLRVLISGLALALLFLLGKRMFSVWAGLIAAALFLVNPPFWYSGLTSPLRPHLALFSLLVAYFCWRAANGERRYFNAASIALGLGGGFRPELSLVLLPLWAWAGWQSGRFRSLLRGATLFALATAVWVTILVIASGGFNRLLITFTQYLNAQTFQTAVFGEAASSGWRRMAGRAMVWNSLGALPWLWTLPFGWWKRHQWPEWGRSLLFLAIWFLPAFLFQLGVHIADPDHALPTIPVVCLIGGLCLHATEQVIRQRGPTQLQRQSSVVWLLLFSSLCFLTLFSLLDDREFVVSTAILLSLLFLTSFRMLREGAPLISIALLGNILLFFGQFPFPQGPPGGGFRGLASVTDAFLGGTYESSYNRVLWINQMTAFAVEQIPRLKLSTDRPLLLIWSRDGMPVWRKIAYYFPAEKIYALDEQGDPGVPVSQARLWSGNEVLARYSGEAPIRLPVPPRARLIWFVAGGRVHDLARIVPLQKSPVLYYTDLPPDAPPIRWGSFEFVPQ